MALTELENTCVGRDALISLHVCNIEKQWNLSYKIM